VALNKRPHPIYVRYQQRCALKFTLPFEFDRNMADRNETLRNAEDARVALHFLIPGCGESLRIKGQASISTAKTLTDHAKLGGWPRPFLAQSLALICPVLNSEALAFSLFGEGNGWA
jgi:hypothetical protein